MAGELQFVGFRVGEQSYALPIAAVREIVRVPHITPVPQSPEHIAGVMNLRGRIVPVVDLRQRFRQALHSSSRSPQAEQVPKSCSTATTRRSMSSRCSRVVAIVIYQPCSVGKYALDAITA